MATSAPTSPTTNHRPAEQSGTFAIGGDLVVNRLGFGAMQITGAGVWGLPRDHTEALAVLRRTIELGINLIDTADSYGPQVSEDLIREALHPYPDDLVIATKAGLTRTGPNQWHPVGRPEYLRQQCEMSLRRLGLEQIGLFQLHRIDPKVPAAEQFGLLRDLQKEGKIRHVGLSEVKVADIEAASAVVRVATVQNKYNLVDRAADDVLAYCARHAIGFIPWYPLATGGLAKAGGKLDTMADTLHASPSQIALAWLLAKSPVMLPIPGTSRVAHLEQNTAAATLRLSDETLAELERLV